MNDISPTEMAAFLDRYRPLSMLGRAETFPGDFERLKDAFKRVKEEAGLRALTEAPAFNIFRLLGIERDEVGAHSRFLVNLLNPNGSHGQGTLFLRAFLEMCWEEDKYPEFPKIAGDFESGRWTCHREMAMQHGRMDIVVMNPLHGFLCVIENKIDAVEGSKQMERYGRWMENRLQEFPSQALIFLTPRGRASDTAGDLQYYRMSYRQDIASWLDGTLPKIQAPGVHELVKQYIGIVQRL